MKHAGKLYKLRPLGKQNNFNNKITSYMNEEVQICGDVFGKLLRYICRKSMRFQVEP